MWKEQNEGDTESVRADEAQATRTPNEPTKRKQVPFSIKPIEKKHKFPTTESEIINQPPIICHFTERIEVACKRRVRPPRTGCKPKYNANRPKNNLSQSDRLKTNWISGH